MNSTMLSESKTTVGNMRRLFRKGDHVRSKADGKVMEDLKYIKKNLVEVMWFDLEKKEPRKNTIREDKLSKAA